MVGSPLLVLAAYPVDVLITDNNRMEGINENDFIELVSTVLCYEIGVEHFKVRILPVHPLLSNSLGGFCGFYAEDTFSFCPASSFNGTLSHAPCTDPGSYDHKSLLCLITKASCPVETRWPLNTFHHRFFSPLYSPLPDKRLHRRTLLWPLPLVPYIRINTFCHIFPSFLFMDSPAHGAHLLARTVFFVFSCFEIQITGNAGRYKLFIKFSALEVFCS